MHHYDQYKNYIILIPHHTTSPYQHTSGTSQQQQQLLLNTGKHRHWLVEVEEYVQEQVQVPNFIFLGGFLLRTKNEQYILCREDIHTLYVIVIVVDTQEQEWRNSSNLILIVRARPPTVVHFNSYNYYQLLCSYQLLVTSYYSSQQCPVKCLPTKPHKQPHK